MEITSVLDIYHIQNEITDDVILSIQKDEKFRVDLVSYFRQNAEREFSISLVDKFISIRQNPNGNMPTEDLMLACYILGLHNKVEDCLKIWEAKNVDFDTYCGLDIQLLPFAGVSKTIEFLNNSTSPEAKKALDYMNGCLAAGDFGDLEEYYSNESMPWFI